MTLFCICCYAAVLYAHPFPAASHVSLEDGSAGKCTCVDLMKRWRVASVICHVGWNNQSRGEGDEKHNPSSIITDVKIQPAGDKESNQNNKINLSKEMNQFHCASSYL